MIFIFINVNYCIRNEHQIIQYKYPIAQIVSAQHHSTLPLTYLNGFVILL